MAAVVVTRIARRKMTGGSPFEVMELEILASLPHPDSALELDRLETRIPPHPTTNALPTPDIGFAPSGNSGPQARWNQCTRWHHRGPNTSSSRSRLPILPPFTKPPL
ncbi:hypothetical protein IMZ48_18245 [Candidatus Bathyarchaeota archaeon]|nr:hypothetical protein [Candidatus Bathyarchaeota archaeon]